MSSQVCPINYIPKVDSRELSYSYKKIDGLIIISTFLTWYVRMYGFKYFRFSLDIKKKILFADNK